MSEATAESAPAAAADSAVPTDPTAIVIELLTKAPATITDPYGHYRALREAAPRYKLDHPTGAGYVLTTYDDCRQMLRNPALDKSAQRPRMGDDRGEDRARTLLFLDGEPHTRLRGLVSRGFTPRRVEALRPQLAALVDELLDGVQEQAGDGGDVDLITHFAYRLPVMVIGELVGVPREDWDMLRKLTRTASSGLEMFAPPDVLAAADGALAEMEAYFTGLVNQRRDDPQDDLISALGQVELNGDRLSVPELISVVVLLFGAGFQTMTDLIGLGVLGLHRHPAELARLRADRSLLPSAIEELLRYDSPVHVLGRAAVEESTFPDGQPIVPGEHVITLIGAANRDPARYADPERLDIGRFAGENPPEVPLSFAWGPHHCIGAQLARAEGQLAFGRLLDRFSVIDVDEDTLSWRTSSTFRGLESLTVHLVPAARG